MAGENHPVFKLAAYFGIVAASATVLGVVIEWMSWQHPHSADMPRLQTESTDVASNQTEPAQGPYPKSVPIYKRHKDVQAAKIESAQDQTASGGVESSRPIEPNEPKFGGRSTYNSVNGDWITLVSDANLDFEDPNIIESAGGDFRIIIDNDSKVDLLALAGSRIGVYGGVNKPGLGGCKSTDISGTSVALREFGKGTYFCAITRHGRLMELKLDDFGDNYFKLKYYVLN